jgi:hypothetical protein
LTIKLSFFPFIQLKKNLIFHILVSIIVALYIDLSFTVSMCSWITMYENQHRFIKDNIELHDEAVLIALNEVIFTYISFLVVRILDTSSQLLSKLVSHSTFLSQYKQRYLMEFSPKQQFEIQFSILILFNR